jgi:hypothetical protein
MRVRFGTLLIAFFDLVAGLLVGGPSVFSVITGPIKFPIGIVDIAYLLTTIIAGVVLLVAGVLVALSGLWGLRHAVRWQYSATVWLGLAAAVAYWDAQRPHGVINGAFTELLYYFLGGLTLLAFFSAMRLHVLYKRSLPKTAE